MKRRTNIATLIDRIKLAGLAGIVGLTSLAMFAGLVFLLLASETAPEPRVNVLARVDGGAIQVECYTAKDQPVVHGKLIISDLVTGETLLEGSTDEQGLFRFSPDKAFLETGHGMNIALDGGEENQGSLQIPPEELRALDR